MAASHAEFASATDVGEARRRNVQAYQNANGAPVHKVEAEDVKKLQRVSILGVATTVRVFRSFVGRSYLISS